MVRSTKYYYVKLKFTPIMSNGIVFIWQCYIMVLSYNSIGGTEQCDREMLIDRSTRQ